MLPSDTPPTLPKEPVHREIVTWETGDVILDHYDVEDVITSGGMGTVYITNHRNWKVKVAIKSPHKEMLDHPSLFQMVIKEAEAWTDLGLHPNIAYCYFVRNIGDVPHIFVEYVDGGNLREWIEEGRCSDLKTGLDLAIQFCHGMAYAHNKGMIHKDIKPGNILMTKDGTLKVTDFGLVQRGTEEGNSPILYTEPYASPEQMSDAPIVGPESDLYSFGVCLWEMFLGRRPRPNAWNDDPLPDPKTIDSSLPDALALLLREMVDLDRNTRRALGGFDNLKEQFKTLYNDLFHEPSPHTELEQVDLEADGLNNQGTSFFELGKIEAALESWQMAVDKNPVHFESNLNLRYFQWKYVEIADDILMWRIRELLNFYDISRYFCPTMRIYLERGMDPNRALQLIDEELNKITLQNQGKKEYRDDLRRLRNEMSENGECKKSIPINVSMGVLEGHSEAVHCACFSADDEYILSGGADNTIRLWEVGTLKCLKVFEGHSDEVRAVAFLPGCRRFVSGSFDMSIKVWNIENGNCETTIGGHELDITSLAVTKDGKRILSSSYDGIIKLWDLHTGECLKTYRGHNRGVIEVALAPDNSSFVSTAFDNTMKIWNLNTAECVHTFNHDYRVNSAKYTPNGRCIITGSSDHKLRLWDIESINCLKTFSGHTGEVSSVDISPDGKHVLSGGRGQEGKGDRSVRLWDLESGRCRCTLTEFRYHEKMVNSVCFSNTGVYALSCSTDKTLRLWGIVYPDSSVPLYNPVVSVPLDYPVLYEKSRQSREICREAQTRIDKGNFKGAYQILRSHSHTAGREYDRNRHLIAVCGNRAGKRISFKKAWNCHTYSHNGKVSCALFSPDNDFVFSGSRDGEIKILKISDLTHHVFASNIGTVQSMDISPDGNTLVTGHWSDKNRIQIWHTKTGERLAAINSVESDIMSVAFSPDGKLISAGCKDGTIYVIDPRLENESFQLVGHKDIVTGVAFSRNGRLLFSRSRDKTMKCWDLQNRGCFASNQIPGKVFCFHPDGQHLITGLQELNVLDVETGKVLWTFADSEKSEFDSIDISNDGRFILTGHRQPYLYIWDYSQKKQVAVLEGHRDSIPALQFSKDNRLAVSGSWDQTVRLWEFDWDWEFNQ